MTLIIDIVKRNPQIHRLKMNTKQILLDEGPVIEGAQAEEVLTTIADWGDCTTIVIHHGSVFEFKGPFPKGTNSFGYYNLAGPTPGLHGHLKIDEVDHITFQEKPHRGRESYALVFRAADQSVIFKVFLGRDETGELYSEQKQKFKLLKKSIEVKK
jgi:putative heme utilization carrier protein HutX